MAGEARATGTPSPAAPDPQPQLRVAIAGFSHLGAWSCEIGPAVPGTAPTVTVEFQVRSDHSMTGSIITSTKGLFRTKRFHEPIQGRADLLFFQPAGAREVHPVIRLEGVRAGAQRFLQDIPVQERLGSVYVGSDARQSFVLKRTGGHGL